MTESLSHKELKLKAVQQLKEMGFSDNEINEEQWVKFEWEGKERRYRVDVLGNNGKEKVIFQVGNHGKIEIDLLKKFFKTVYISYPKYITTPLLGDKSTETLQERKKSLIVTYKQLVQHLKNDEIFDFLELTEENESSFKIGLDGSWMLIPHKSAYSKNEVMNNINICLYYVGNDFYEITINAEVNEAIRLFLSIIPEDKKEYIKLINKLPKGYFIQDGFKYRQKGVHHAQRMPRDWEDVSPYDARTFSYDDLRDIEMRLNFLLDSVEEKYPVLKILSIGVKKNDIIKVFQQIRPIYKLLKTVKTFEKDTLNKIKSLSNWEWHIEEKLYDDLYSLFCERYKESKISFGDFKKVVNQLKKDMEYLKYKES
ncbi:hypothetical protein COV16_06530 [Candidatus Woesearchaeota archaeon CG10_big_fil_rev_8_21_14_0_10_34_8]|nr:MAG: hypothetical protein COV16_06530 [Candidatus Woesearchaeota archaeon CG10_big_fil_rev_8_21_14_0_10_34_8]